MTEEEQTPDVEEEEDLDIDDLIAESTAPDESEEEEPDEVQAEPEAVEPDPDLEAEARKYGWRPESEWRGDKSGWVPAKRFMELPSTHVRQLRDENKAMKAEFDSRVAGLERGTKAALEAQKRAHEKELADAQARQRKAAEEGDMEAFDAATKAQEELRKSAPGEEPQAKPGPSPELTAYVESDEGKWLKDPYMLKRAYEIIEEIPPERRPSGARAQAEEAAKALKKYYPHVFGTQQETQKPPPRNNVDPGGLAGGGKKSLASKLPSEARVQAKEFIEMGLFKNTEEYARDYFGDQS